MNLSKKSQNGFTLIEVLVAVVIFAVGVMAMLAFNGIILTNNDLTGSAINAQGLAQAQMEKLTGLPAPAADLSLCTSINDYCHADIGGGLGALNGTAAVINLEGYTPNAIPSSGPWVGRFLRDWTVASSGTATLLRVRVRWNDSGLAHTQSTTTRSIILTTQI